MGETIQVRRGPHSRLPELANGEMALTTDTKDVYIGTPTGNELIGGQTITSSLAEKAKYIEEFPIQIPETDDSGRLQRAVNSGYNIILKYKGSYTIDKVRFWSSGVTIFGNESLINARSVTSECFVLGSNIADGFVKVSDIKIENIDFKGVQTLTTTSNTSVGISAKFNQLVRGSGCENIEIYKCKFSQFTMGISVTSVTNLNVHHCYFKNNYYSEPLGAGGYGVLLQNCFDVTLDNNIFVGDVGDRHAMYISNKQPDIAQGENVVIKNNKIDWSNTLRKNGFETCIAIRSYKGIIIDGNFIVGGFGGIDLNPSNGNIENIKIINNDIVGIRTEGVTERACVAFQIDPTYKVKQCVIDNNNFEGVSDLVHGVTPTKGEGIKITRNNIEITGASSLGIALYDNMSILVDKNTLTTDNAGVGLRYYGTNSKVEIGTNLYTGFLQNEYQGSYVSDLKHSFARQAKITSNGSGTITVNTDADKIITSVSSHSNGFSVAFSNLCNVELGDISIVPIGSAGVYFFNRLNPSQNVIEIGINDFSGVSKPLANLAITFVIVINK